MGDGLIIVGALLVVGAFSAVCLWVAAAFLAALFEPPPPRAFQRGFLQPEPKIIVDVTIELDDEAVTDHQTATPRLRHIDVDIEWNDEAVGTAARE